MNVILSEILTTEYTISTPFSALLGRVPVQVYAVLDRTAVCQIIGEDDRRVIRHDLITVDSDRLRLRPTPLLDQLKKSRDRGRVNSIKSHEKNGKNGYHIGESESVPEEAWSEYEEMEVVAGIATEDRSSES